MRSARVGAAIVIALVAAAHAEPAATYAQAMTDGARLMKARDAAGAAKAYEAALVATPKDPRALAELSWARFSTGDFEAAEDAAAQAILATSDRKLKAMALYNQGRAREALNRAADAADSYTASLALRDNAEVRTRRGHLAAAMFAPRKLAGPFAKPEEFCKEPCGDDVTLDIDARTDEASGNLEHLARPPFVGVAKILTPDKDPDAYFSNANLALKVGTSWYVLPSLGVAGQGHGGGHSIDVHMVGQRLVVDWTSSIGRFSHDDERAVFVCGVGASKQPTCVGPISTERTSTIDHCAKDVDCKQRADFIVQYHCRAELRGDTLTVSRNPAKIESYDEGVQSGPSPDACKQLPTFGSHPLTF